MTTAGLFRLLVILAAATTVETICAADPADAAANVVINTGKNVYEFYCYQCHGYAGDAKTLASTFVDPPPRDFTAPASRELSYADMLSAVGEGRPGTAMVSFRSVLSTTEISAVIDYIRTMFMTGEQRALAYHTAANGWDEHERHAAAFPFAKGEISLDTPWDELTPEQVGGKRLYMSACVTCHDRGVITQEGPAWEARAVSYPRRHYSHRAFTNIDGISGATPFARHDRLPTVGDLDPVAQRGQDLFQVNCAFCHGGDGSGRNWIGSFLEPHPRDLGGSRIAHMNHTDLTAAIKEGLADTSMPAWKDVLDDLEIDAIVTYIKRAFVPAARHKHETHVLPARAAEQLQWHRQTWPLSATVRAAVMARGISKQ